MKTFVVRIKAIITKDYKIKAKNEQEAEEFAHSVFIPNHEDGVNEKYEQSLDFVVPIVKKEDRSKRRKNSRKNRR